MGNRTKIYNHGGLIPPSINSPRPPPKNKAKRRDNSRIKWEGPRRGGTDFILELSLNVVTNFGGPGITHLLGCKKKGSLTEQNYRKRFALS